MSELTQPQQTPTKPSLTHTLLPCPPCSGDLAAPPSPSPAGISHPQHPQLKEYFHPYGQQQTSPTLHTAQISTLTPHNPFQTSAFPPRAPFTNSLCHHPDTSLIFPVIPSMPCPVWGCIPKLGLGTGTRNHHRGVGRSSMKPTARGHKQGLIFFFFSSLMNVFIVSLNLY